MSKSYNPRLRQIALEVARNQVRNGDPPETKQTLQRLIAAGHSKKEAEELIGCVVVCELHGVMHDRREFNRDQFVKALAALPTPPWDVPGSGYE